MQKLFKKEDEEFQIFNEFWRITQEFYEPESSDEYWQKFLDATVQFEKNHKNNPLCEQMILLLMEYLEKKYRKDNPSKYNSAAYLRLLTRVRYAYKDFLEKADDKDKKLLDEVLKDNKGLTEERLLEAIIHHETL